MSPRSCATSSKADIAGGLEARLDQGLAAHQAGQLAAAEDAYRQVLAAHADHPRALHYLGLIAQQTGRADQARRLLRRALAQSANDPLIAHNLAEVDVALGQDPVARKLALAIDPGFALAIAGLGYDALRRSDGATAALWLRRRLALGSDDLNVLRQLGNLAVEARHFDLAYAYFEQLEASGGHDLPCLSARLELAQMRGDFSGRIQLSDQIAHALESGALATEADWRVAAKLLYLDLFEDWGMTRRAALTATLSKSLGPRQRANRPRSAGPLRLGYLSGNFGDHPIGHVMVDLFGAHDRARVLPFAYALRDRSTETQPFAQRIKGAVHCYRDLSALDPSAAAAAIRADDIDVLIDLDGLMSYRGLEILAQGVAPRQYFWLGHADMPALPIYDGVLADRFVAPAGDGPHLIGCYHVASPWPVGPLPTRAEAGLPATAVVLCAFNNPQKFDGQLFDDWRQILARLPEAVLWLSDPFDDRGWRDNARTTLGEAGNRVIFAGRVADKSAYLARLALADLFLDSYRLNASTTALDALLAGVPLLTRQGARFGERIAGDFLECLGLADWIAPDRQSYIDRAVAWAGDRAARTAMRTRLEAARSTAPLFDVADFVRRFENTLINQGGQG